MRTNLSCSVVLGLFCDALMCFVLLFLFFHDVLLLFVLGFLISAPPFFILILFRLGLDEKTPTFSFSSSAKVEIEYFGRKIFPSNLFFRRKMRFWARKSSAEKKEMPRKRRFLPQKWPNRTKKGGFGANMIGRGSSEKTDFTADFATL